MDKKFNKWVEEFDRDFRDSTAYNIIAGVKGYNEPSRELMGWYIRYKQEKLTRLLVFGTWALVIVNIALIFLKR
jgi:hypothetical protein